MPPIPRTQIEFATQHLSLLAIEISERHKDPCCLIRLSCSPMPFSGLYLEPTVSLEQDLFDLREQKQLEQPATLPQK